MKKHEQNANAERMSREKEFIKANGPKRPLGSYFLFVKEQRDILKAENSTMGFKDMNTYLADKWGNLSDMEKLPYIEEANKLKEAYNLERKQFDEGPLAKYRENERKRKEQDQLFQTSRKARS